MLILSATAEDETASNQVYNVAFSERTTLNELYTLIQERVVAANASATEAKPQYRDFRAGDVRHSLADITKAKNNIGYEPEFSIITGLDKAAKWYLNTTSRV